ncbi:hypothetical protein LR48_Vigan04g177500 [Vigna angularis]|uniref:Uncharacterized protein n=1 Tax=Phaseolus angularis TaxID=3914 RepID=A0A0L9UG99_PHAAN|nr:hypothetical protein LR48_Vigan04g177500 [Vigna angularis]
MISDLAGQCDMGARPSDTGVRLSYGRLGHFVGRTIVYAVARHFVGRTILYAVARHFVGRTILYAVARHFVGRTILYAVARHFMIPDVRLSASSCRTLFVSMESAALSCGDGIPCEFFKVSLKDRGEFIRILGSIRTYLGGQDLGGRAFVCGGCDMGVLWAAPVTSWASFVQRPALPGTNTI